MSGTSSICVAALLASVSAMASADSGDSVSAGNTTTSAEDQKSVDGAEVAQLDPILVTGQRNAYGARDSRTATKTNTRILDIPQALTVISEKQVEDQALRSVAELLYFVPGATPGTGESNRDQFTLRGNNSTADLFIDGIRDDAQYFRDFYNIERVEVLRGPNAMIFGRGGGGGIVNRVTKRASLGNFREFLAGTSSEGGLRATADIDQSLGDGFGIRINALGEEGRSFRHHVRLNRYGFSPTIGAQLGSSTRIDLGYEYLRDRRTADRGIPANGDRPLRGEDKTFFGDPEHSRSRADVHLGNLAIEHDFGGGLTLRNRTVVARYDKFYQNIYPTGYSAATDLVTLGAYNSRNDRTNAISQTDLVYDAPIAGLDQTLLVGVELGRQTSRNRRLTGTIVGGNKVPLADPTVDVDVIFAPVASDANNRTRAAIAAAYIQEQLRPTEWLELVAGVRFDSFKLSVDDLRGAGAEFSRRDDLVSPRFGLVLKPTEHLSFYASSSRSYLPQSGDQFSGLDLNTEALKPERFDNLEVGVKWEPVAGLLATAAVYQLDRSNTRAVDPTNPTRIVLTGEQRSRGLELGLERSITDRWLISAGYSWQKAEITRTTTAAPAGRSVPLVPRHSFSLWSRYDFSRTIGAGLGLIARSKSYASISNAVTLPGYARLDGAVYYKLGRGIEAQVNVENILGAHYFPTAHNDNNIAPGAPRTVKATLGYRF